MSAGSQGLVTLNTKPVRHRHGRATGTAAWLAASAAVVTGLASIMTIGMLFLVPGVTGIALLARSRRLRAWWPAAVVGPAVQQYAPWPFLAAAAVLVIVGGVLWWRSLS